jgi:hypothetical protein
MAEDVEALVKREVEAARKILREDGIIASQKAIREKLDKHFPDEPEPGSDDPQPPDRKPEPEPSQPEKKKGIWWGDNV